MSIAPELDETLDTSSLYGLAEFRPARAYCGPAHGQCWVVDNDDPPPAEVDLAVDGQQVCYQLVRHPRTRLAARDYLGNYLYIPVGQGLELLAAHTPESHPALR